MSCESDGTADVLSWRVGVYGGAALGGIVWGLIAIFTIGARGDQSQHDGVDGIRLLFAALACGALGIVGLCLLRLGRNRSVRTVGLGSVVASLSGWVIFASLSVQHFLGWA
jgi:hypothetical protein